MQSVVQCGTVVVITVILAVAPSCKGKKQQDKVPPSTQTVVGDAGAAASTAAQPSTAAGGFARDVQRICDATARSGALEVEEAYRAVTVAQWLAQKIETQEGRDLLGRVARLAPKDKAKELRAAATKIGLPDCETAAAWVSP